MTIENLKQIAIKYATTKGSRVPLAPDELCNAVVQYFNEFLKITADINTIQVAVTEEGGNIVFTITGNTLDGKAFTPIVITVDHNDFVTDQEFEEFKTNILDSINSLNNSITEINNTIKNINDTLENNTTDITGLKNRVDNTETNIAKINSTLNNKLDKITIVSNSNQVYGKSAAGKNLMYNLESHPHAGYILQYDSDGKIYVNKGSSEYTPANMQNIADVEAKIPDVSGFATKEELKNVQNSLTNKRSVISSPASSYVVYTQANGLESNLPYSELANQTSTNIMARRANGTSDVKKGISGENVANMENIADVEAKIPSITNLADVTKENTFTDVNHFTQYITTFGIEIGALEFNDDEYDVSISNATIEIFHYISGGNANSIRITDEQIWVKRYNVSDYNSFNFPNKSGTLALTSDIPDTSSFVTLAGDNTFGGTNTFNNSIYAKNGVVAGDTTNYGANSVTKGSNTYSFPNKSGTFAMTNDIIKTPIYFISFYANDPSEPCHLIGTMMSKNSYGTGQKTNEEFAVMLADNLYTNSNEGLATYGRLANKDILCIYSEDGLSIRCLDEENSEVDLPAVMFFVMETEL